MKNKFAKRILSAAASAAVFISGFLPAMNFATADAEEYAADGLPILQSYEDSMWYRGNELGVAGDFGFFAFDFLDGAKGSHQNMNFAAPHVINIEPMYIQSTYADAGRFLDVASVSLENGTGEFWWSPKTNTDLVVTPDYQFHTITGGNINYGISVRSVITPDLSTCIRIMSQTPLISLTQVRASSTLQVSETPTLQYRRAIRIRRQSRRLRLMTSKAVL